MKKWLFAILFLALVLRLGWAIYLKDAGLMFGDSVDYNHLGLSLAEGRGYVDTEGNPTACRSPLYPIFIGCIYWLFGHSLFAVRLFQVVLGVISCYVLFLVGRRIFNPQVGLIGAFLFAWNPYLIYYTGAILQETLFIFVVLITFYFLSRINDEYKFILLAGIFGGLSILTREVFLIYVPFLFIGSLILIEGSIWVKFRKIAILFICLLIIWGPWLIRNYFIYGKLTTRRSTDTFGEGSNLWVCLWHGNNPYIGVSFEKECWFFSKGAHEELSKIPFEERNAYARKKALETIFSNPLQTLRIQIIKFGRFWRPYPHQTKLLGEITGGLSSKTKIIGLVSDGWIIPLGLVGFLLALPLWKRHLFHSLWIWGMCLCNIFPMIRFRLPVMPIVMLFTGYTIFLGYKFLFSKKIK